MNHYDQGNLLFRTLFFFLFAVAGSQEGFASSQLEPIPPQQQAKLQQDLDQFFENTREAMNAQLPKVLLNQEGQVQQNQSRVQVDLKTRDQVRQQIMDRGEGNFSDKALVQNGDRVRHFVDNPQSYLRRLEDINRRGLTSAQLSKNPWSDDYWPIRNGSIARRYADDNFPKKGSWAQFYRAYQQRSTESYISNNQSHLLSPAEKYDLLVGDKNFTMTRKSWQLGQGYYRRDGKVERWMGICHGWAAVAMQVDRPKHKFSILSADGQHELTFYPSDVKALMTLLWAEGSFQSRFVGGRCNAKKENLASDGNGRIIDQKCFDTNPGTWHMAVVNQLGVNRRSMIIDATFDYEVWNQPVYRYSYIYFNPQTRKGYRSLNGAAISLSQYSKDPFRKYRSNQARTVVGVQMKVDYIVETQPRRQNVDSPKYDGLKRVVYTYDLELDQNGVIIGGEWYTNNHPDFLWIPAIGAKAKTKDSAYVTGQWNPKKSKLPGSWAKIAQRASLKRHPVEQVVDGLWQLAQSPSQGTYPGGIDSTPTPPSPGPTDPEPEQPNPPTRRHPPIANGQFYKYCQDSSGKIKRTVKKVLKYLRTDNCATAQKMLFTTSSLSLVDMKIKALEPLSDLYNLRSLNLQDNKIKDLWPLARLTNLVHLNLDENKIKSLAPLKNLRNLRTLSVEDNKVKADPERCPYRTANRALNAYCRARLADE